MGSFLIALAPQDQENLDPNFDLLVITGFNYQTLGIAVPGRAPRTNERPLQGLRFAVEDSIRLRGLKTSLCNAAYLSISSPSDTTARIVRNTIAAGANVVGMTKLSSMNGREEPTEAVDYHATFNPRGDGYQSPAGSNSGSAAAVAAYDWLDFAIGTDTTGGAGMTALVNGVFQFRPTYNAHFLDGIVPVFKPWDAPVLFARDVKILRPVLSAWYQSEDVILSRVHGKRANIIYPFECLPVDNKTQMDLIEKFLAHLAKCLNTYHYPISITSLWKESRPDEAENLGVQEYLKDCFINANFYDYYHTSTSDFRKTYEERFQKRPYVTPSVDWKWKLGEAVTQAQRDEALRRFEVYKKFFLDHVMQQDAMETFLVMPISNVVVNYRDAQYPAPVARPTGFDPLILSPILGAPNIVVPIGEYEYDSRVSGKKEYLPVAINIIGPPGSDFRLVDTIQRCLEFSGRPTRVCAGSRMFYRLPHGEPKTRGVQIPSIY